MGRSPYFDAGAADGEADAIALSRCPPKRAVGQNPSKSWSIMYRRGYESAFKPQPCDHSGDCEKAKQRERGKAQQRRAPLAFKPGRMALKPGKMAFKPGSLAYDPRRGALAAKMQARAEQIRSGNGQ